jgi:hypothetical protein
MIKQFGIFFILIFFDLQMSISQDIRNNGYTNRLIGDGTIGNDLKISMTLDLITRTDYSADMCINKNFEQIIGSYTYIKNGGSISIVGKLIDWTNDAHANDSLVVYELNDNFDKTAEFRGVVSRTGFSGKWISLKNKKELPFKINFNPTIYGNLSALYSGENIHLTGLSAYSYQSTFELIDRIEKNDTLYLITRTIEPCCGYYNCRGMNCGGSNEYLYLHILTRGYQKYCKELIGSGCNTICEILHTTKATDSYAVVIEKDNEQFIVKIDYKNFDIGIQKIKIK